VAALTPKQLAFCEQYLVDLNAKAAAVRAGYSEAGAGQVAHKLLKRPHIQRRVAKMLEERSKRVEITQDAVIAELAKIAFGDPRKVMEWGPNGLKLKNSGEIADDDAAMVAEVSETTSLNGGTIKLKTCDKIKALELIGRHLGIFTDKSEVKITSPVVINIPARGE
jgi:phage terminase small subunit